MKFRPILFLIITSLILPLSLRAQDGSSADPESSTLIFVRHAEKLNDGSKDPELSEVGNERAAHLASFLVQNYQIKGIYSTPYKRTLLTATPLADSLNLEIHEYEWKEPEQFITQVMQKHEGEDVLIVGHSNTTAILVNKVLQTEKYDWLKEDEYDSMFILTIRDGKVIKEQKSTMNLN